MTEKPNLATATGNLLHIFPELEDESNQHPWLKVLFSISMGQSSTLIAALKKAGFVEYLKANLKDNETMRKPSSQPSVRLATKEIMSIIEANKAEVFEYYATRGQYRHAGKFILARNHFIQWTNPLKKDKDFDNKIKKIAKVTKLKKKNALVAVFDTTVRDIISLGFALDKNNLSEIFNHVWCNRKPGFYADHAVELAYARDAYIKCLDILNGSNKKPYDGSFDSWVAGSIKDLSIDEMQKLIDIIDSNNKYNKS